MDTITESNISSSEGHEKEKSEKPFVSVIIATRNEEKHIGKLLDSLVEQTYPKDRFEVLIFDGMSEDRTLEIIERYKNKLNLKIYKNPKIIQVFAWNKGINISSGSFVIFMNAHAVCAKNIIERNIDTFFQVRKKEPKLVAAGGRYINIYNNIFGKIVGLLYSSFFTGAGSGRWRTNSHFSDSTIFGVWDKKILFEENEKFDENFIVGEDFELPLRLRKKGYKFFTNSDVKIYYSTRGSFIKFIKQTYNYAVSFGLMIRKGHFSFKWFIPTFFLMYEISLIIIFSILYFSFIFKLVLIPFILYWLINIYVCIYLLVKTKDALCFVLPLFYFIFHNILGVGFLTGLIRGKNAFWVNKEIRKQILKNKNVE